VGRIFTLSYTLKKGAGFVTSSIRSTKSDKVFNESTDRLRTELYEYIGPGRLSILPKRYHKREAKFKSSRE